MKRVKNSRILSGERGFTLIELLVVLIIIGVLAGLGIPKYFRAVERSRAQEGIMVLSAIYQAQQRFQQRTGVYAANGNALDVDIPVATALFGVPAITATTANIARIGGGQGDCGPAYTIILTYGAATLHTTTDTDCAFVLP